MCKAWVKMYTDILHDRKMLKMTEHEQLVFLKLLAVAGQEDKDGLLPPVEDICLELYGKTYADHIDDTCAVLDRLTELDIVLKDDNAYILKNFVKRQDTDDDTSKDEYVRARNREYMRKYRQQKKQANTSQEEDCNLHVNYSKSHVNYSNLQEKEEREKEEDSPLSSPSFPSSSPCTPIIIPITPYNPPLQEEKGKEEKELTAIAEPLFAVDPPKKARQKAQRPRLEPTDDAFWDTFGDSKEMALSFYQATGIFPVGSEFGRWKKDLSLFREASVSVEYMLQAVEKIQSEGRITIGAPGSVFKTARSLMMQPKATQKESWTERAERIEAEMSGFDFLRLASSEESVVDV